MKKQNQSINVPILRTGPGHGGGGPGAHFANPKEKAKDSRGTLKKLWAYLKADKKGIFLVFFIVFFNNSS